MSMVSLGEVYDGVLNGPVDPVSQERRFLAWLEPFEVIGLDRDTMRIYAGIRGDLRARGQMIGENDLLIAATALRHDLTLVTRNRRHFGWVRGLRLDESDGG